MKAAKLFLPVLVLLLGVVPGCGQQPIVVPGRSLDRPTDLAFLCLAARPLPEGKAVTAQAASLCLDAPASLETRTNARLGLVTNSARGELGAVDFDRNRMIDLDQAIAGFNMLPVGQLPESVAVSSDGCRAVTANRGSCDLSVIDTTRLLADVFPDALPSTGPGAVTNRVPVMTASGPLRARPAQVRFVPGPTPEPNYSCSIAGGYGGAVDATGQAQLAPWRAIVTFPGCGLVALVDVPSGRLVDSVFVQTDGTVLPGGTQPQCPAECGASLDVPSDDAEVDAGTADGGRAPSGSAPGRLAVGASAFLPYQGGEGSRQRLYVAGRNGDVVVPLAVDNGDKLSAERVALTLAEQAGGVLRLVPTINPFAPPENAWIGTAGRFIYAIAGDGSARVINVSEVSAGGAENECDANIDSLVWATMGPTMGPRCIPVGSGLPRRLGTRGPGVQVPLEGGRDVPPPAAVDIAFFEAQPAKGGAVNGIRFYDGAFGYLLLTNGDILIVNLESRQVERLEPGQPQALPPPHSLRNSRTFQELTRGGQAPRVSTTPIASLATNDLPFAVRATLPRELYPRLEEVPAVTDNRCSPFASAATPTSIFACFPRPNETVEQRWEVVWEGTLPGSGRTTGRFTGDPAGALGAWDDAGANYCASGAQAGDRLRLIGCGVDRDCGSPDVFSCVASSAGAPGICARRAQASAVANSEVCKRFVASRRRYQVLSVEPTRMTFGLLFEELVRPTTVGACQQDQDCVLPGAEYTEGLSCIKDATGAGGRCLRTCEGDPACRDGFVCVGGFCAEAPPPDPLCLSESSVYRVQAGQAFLVSGSRAAPFTTMVNQGGSCQPIVGRNPRQSNRIPLSAPLCAPGICESSPYERFFQVPMTAAGESANPCLCQGVNANGVPDAVTPHTKAIFETPELRFVLTNLEQPFGDGANMSFQTVGGFWPDWILTPQSGVPSVAVPTRILHGPTQVPPDEDLDEMATERARYPYIYVVDSGRLGTQQRGQILRLDTRRAGYDTARSSRRFEVQ